MDTVSLDFNTFFESNAKIKFILAACAPMEADNYGDNKRFLYGEKLYDGICDLEYYFKKILESINMDDKSCQHIKSHFRNIKENFNAAGYDFKKLHYLYTHYMNSMSSELIFETKETLVGYTLFCFPDPLFEKCKTLHEFLHVLHSYVMNNENFYQSLPAICEKQNDSNYPIALRGDNKNVFGQKLFDAFPASLDCGWTDIIALKNKLLIMVRDRGHALTLDIDIKQDNVEVKYFIPKICNVGMVNSLPGVRRVENDAKWTTGFFVSQFETFAIDIISLIGAVPMDSDMDNNYLNSLRV